MRPSAILESALYAEDLDAAEEFYTCVLGMERIARVDGRHVFFRCGKGVLLVFNPNSTATPPAPDARLPVPPHGARGQGHLCFAASAGEIESWIAHLSAHGVDIEADFTWPPREGLSREGMTGDGAATGGRSIYVRDPAGNSIEFAEPRIWGL